MVPLHESSVRWPADAADRTAEMQPVLVGHVALGDGDEAREPRLRREQVVVVVVRARPAVTL